MKMVGYLPDDLVGEAGVDPTYEAQPEGHVRPAGVQSDAAGRPSR